jgi:DNA-binding GntR family transcriptional regulator
VEALGGATGTPVLVSRRTTATADGRPFLFDEAYLPPDRVRVVVSRQGTRCTTDLVPVFAAPQ